MTSDEKDRILDIGWELCKIHDAADICYWLATEGWEGGYQVLAQRADTEHVSVRMRSFEVLKLAAPFSGLN